MAYVVQLPVYSDAHGTLTVLDSALPFEVRRVYCIYDASRKRGGHRHKTNRPALVLSFVIDTLPAESACYFWP